MAGLLHDSLRLSLSSYQQASGWCVAFSGGLDSTVLLHSLAMYAERFPCPPLRAIHIHHGLQAVADDWPAHCAAVCAALGIPLQVVYVAVDGQASAERAARDARYQAFAASLQPGEVLMLGQHQDDQAETLVLRLLRGAGVAGLQAMPLSRELAAGSLLRPLLAVSRQQLKAYAEQHGLNWVEDPSNQADDYDRNFLRNRVMPLLQQRWPAVGPVLQRTAGHMQEAQQLLAELALQDLQQVQTNMRTGNLELPALQLDLVRQLSLARQKNMLRHWLADKGRAADTAHWQGWQDLLNAARGSEPLWQLEHGVLQRYRQLAYWIPDDWRAKPQPLQLTINAQGTYPLGNNGRLHVRQLPAPVVVGYRQGGECMQLPGRGQRDLKRLLQEHGVAPFLRQRLPLLFARGELVAVAGLPALRADGWQQLQLDWELMQSGGFFPSSV